jgi:hypothetical protein
VVFPYGGGRYPPDGFGGAVLFDDLLEDVLGKMGKDEFVYELGRMGVNVEEVELKLVVVGPVAVEVKLDGMDEVPVPEIERDELVLLP